MKCIFPFRKGLSIHGNLITHMRASVTCCIHNIGHKNGIHTHNNNDDNECEPSLMYMSVLQLLIAILAPQFL